MQEDFHPISEESAPFAAEFCKTIEGDLIELALRGEFDVIVHGCNCFCAMDGGIAKSIKAIFPEAYEADCLTDVGDRRKLGSFSSVTVLRGNATLTIINAYTQFHWEGEGVLVDYLAVEHAFAEIKRRYAGNRIGYPKIGAGLARGDWSIITKIIDEQLAGEDHCLVLHRQQ